MESPDSKTSGGSSKGPLGGKSDKDHAVEELMSKLGEIGRYQRFQYFLHLMGAMMAGLHMLSLVTVAMTPDHRCFLEGVDTNKNVAPFDSASVKDKIPKKSDGSLDNCYMNGDPKKMACKKWVYDTQYRKSSRTIQWNLVCGQRWKRALAQTIYMLGVFWGAIVLGSLADKFGRKKIFLFSAFMQLIFGVTVAFMTEYWPFICFRFMYGLFGSTGAYIAGFVLTMELVGATRRTLYGIIFQVAFAVGVILVAAWGAIIESCQTLQIVYGLHALLFIPHIFLMDESPRWLWIKGRTQEAVDIVAKGVKCNKGEPLDVAHFVARGQADTPKSNTGKSATTFDLFKTKKLRNMTLNICLCWFANSIVYYGLTLSSGNLEGNPYVILAILGLVEIPSYAGTVFLLGIWGRRPLITIAMLIGGACCIIATFFPIGTTGPTIITIIGKLFIASSFAVIYIYSAELFPTVVRNSGVGLGSMCARLSGALTPLIGLLDALNPKVPAIIFGLITIISGLLCLYLPETRDKMLPETLEDGEQFGEGEEPCLKRICKKRSGPHKVHSKTWVNS